MSLELLVQADCDAVQGYFLSRPLEPAALLEFMRQRARDTLVTA